MTDDFIDAATIDAHIAAQPKDWIGEELAKATANANSLLGKPVEIESIDVSGLSRANSIWCRENSITDDEYDEVGALLCDHSPRDIALMFVRIREAARDLLEATSRTAFHHNTTIKSDPSFGLAGDNIPVDGGSPPTPLTFGHLRRLFSAICST